MSAALPDLSPEMNAAYNRVEALVSVMERGATGIQPDHMLRIVELINAEVDFNELDEVDGEYARIGAALAAMAAFYLD